MVELLSGWEGIKLGTEQTQKKNVVPGITEG